MMTNQVKWGILGYARIAKSSVIPGILRSEHSQLYAIASSDPEKRRECQELYGCPKVYENYEDVLNDDEVQAVYIPLPNSLHKEWAIKAVQRGKHVLCEKPIALHADECRELIETAAEHRVHVMEAFMYRYTDRMQKVQEVLASGEIGEVRYIQSTFRFLLNRPNTIKVRPELGGGSLYDVGCYPVNFVGMITNAVPASCASHSVIENGIDVMFSATMQYENGIIASIHSGFNAFNQMNSEIIGTLGRIEIPDTFAGTAGVVRVVTSAGARDVDVAESDRYGLEVNDFAEAVLHNRPPKLTMEESYRNMQVMDLLLKSMK